jgi:hypothetical protein
MYKNVDFTEKKIQCNIDNFVRNTVLVLRISFCRTKLHFVGINMRNVGLKMYFSGLKIHFDGLKVKMHFVGLLCLPMAPMQTIWKFDKLKFFVR